MARMFIEQKPYWQGCYKVRDVEHGDIGGIYAFTSQGMAGFYALSSFVYLTEDRLLWIAEVLNCLENAPDLIDCYFEEGKE